MSKEKKSNKETKKPKKESDGSKKQKKDPKRYDGQSHVELYKSTPFHKKQVAQKKGDQLSAGAEGAIAQLGTKAIALSNSLG